MGWGEGGGERKSCITAVENRLVSFTYLIVDSKVCLLSMRSSVGRGDHINIIPDDFLDGSSLFFCKISMTLTARVALCIA